MELGPIISSLLRNKVGAVLISLQIALTLAIVTNAVFIIQDRATKIARPSGLDEANTAVFYTTLFDTSQDEGQVVRQDVDAIAAIPSVQAVTPMQATPVSGGGWGEDLYITRDQSSDESIGFGNFMVNENGIEALGVKLVAGRNFYPQEVVEYGLDNNQFPGVMIVSQALADALFPDGDALGKLVWDEPTSAAPTEIIGIYERMQNAWPNSVNDDYSALIPAISRDNGSSKNMTYFIRSRPGQINEALNEVETYLGLNRGRYVRIARTFAEQKKRTYSSDIAMVKLLTGVISLLIIITGLGIVGLAWFGVSQRRKQIGTRRALGARKWDIVRYFMLENWIITGAGVVLGAGLSIYLNYFLDTHYQVGRMGLWYIPMGMLCLWLLGQLAVLAPARRAAGIPPALATRSI